MRPIFKGNVPQVNGGAKSVKDYKNWRKDLIERLGAFCCFCNVPLKDSIQVEHVIAQDIDSSKSLDWDNMLLACGPCNRSKSNHPCPPSTHLLPEIHNTHLGFTHSPIQPHYRIPKELVVYLRVRPGFSDRSRAEQTLELCKLDRDTTRVADQVTDLRWKWRFEALVSAQLWRQDWDNWGKDNSRFINLLKDVALGKGFWSIWFDVFSDVREVREMLVKEFPGTNQGMFDSDYHPI